MNNLDLIRETILIVITSDCEAADKARILRWLYGMEKEYTEDPE